MDPVENDLTNSKISVKLLVKCKNYIIKIKREYFCWWLRVAGALRNLLMFISLK